MKKFPFTLIEVLTVVSILAILSGGVIAVYRGFDKTSAKGQARNDIQQLSSLIKIYQATTTKYPFGFDSLLSFSSTISFAPDTGYSTERGSFFEGSSQENQALGLAEIRQGDIALANFNLVSWLSEHLKNKLQKCLVPLNSLKTIVASGIYQLRYVDASADHNSEIHQRMQLSDSSLTVRYIEKSSHIENASQAFENPRLKSNGISTARNLGRGFTFFLAKDELSKNDAIGGDNPPPFPFAVLKPGIRGERNYIVGANRSDVLIALGIGRNCSLINTNEGQQNINNTENTLSVTSVPSYGSADKSVYARYIALFKIGKFVNDEEGKEEYGKDTLLHIDSSGEFSNPNLKNISDDVKFEESNPIQFISVIDCYGNSSYEIFNQYKNTQ